MPEHPGSALRDRARAFGAGLAHALLLGLAFPPVGWWWLAFAAPLPVFWLARHPGRSPWGAGFWAMLGVAPFWVFTHAWIVSVSAAGIYPLVLYLGLYTWVFVPLTHRAMRGAERLSSSPAIVLVVCWCGLEFFRASIAWSGYAWYMLGHPMIDSPGAALAWPALLGGVPLVSMLVAAPGAWLVTRRTGGRAASIVTGLLLAVWVGWAILRPMPASDGASVLRVGVVQTNVPQDNRVDWSTAQRLDDWLAMRDQTERLAASEPAPDLIVWPEGLVPGWTFDPAALDLERSRGIVWRITPDSPGQAARLFEYGSTVPATRVVDEILATQRGLGIPMLVGSVAFDGLRIDTAGGRVEYHQDAMYNSAFLVEHGRVADVWYDKMHLTPFGEVMPYISAWPWLEERLLAIGAEGMSFALDPARSARTIPLLLPDGRAVELATPICFEATTPAVCRRLARLAGQSGRPAILINITNDGWFGGSDRGRRMHRYVARWRCVELGIPMVRAANTGVSGSIDRFGRVIEELPPRVRAEAVMSVEPGFAGTLFARVGDWAGWVSMLGVLPLLWLGRGRKSGVGASSAEDSGIV